jgi:aerobic carbon-monoxide dehydrogenase small subunit
MIVRFALNGAPFEAEVRADTILIDLLRDRGHVGTKEGCGVGVCGLCTVLINDAPASSCIYLAACAADADVWTAEGLTDRDPRLLESFVRHEGMQCGICTPGQVVSAYALRLDHPRADEDQVRAYLAGNLCRCTGYASIVDAAGAYLAAE